MKFLYLLYADESRMPAYGSPEMQQQADAFDGFFKEVSAKGLFQSGDPVQPSSTATTVRVRNGSTEAIPGPGGGGGDQIIGFYVMDCKDQDEAVTYAAKVPISRVGAVEVRPILAL
jgi:hypothetical protein